jgi:hypothetical protein
MLIMVIAAGSIAAIGFGLWHFFVPGMWNWYSFIDARATELLLAVRAVNFFFSLSLLLFGAMNLLFVWHGGTDRFPLLVLLAAGCVLWTARVLLQLYRPQGTLRPGLRYGMLAAFVLVLLCHLVPLCLLLRAQ